MFEDPWPADRPLLKTIAGFSIPILLVGAFGYRYLTTATPVSADQALRLFRVEKGMVSTAPEEGGGSVHDPAAAAREHRSRRDTTQREPVRQKERAATRRVTTVQAAAPTQQRAEQQPDE